MAKQFQLLRKNQKKCYEIDNGLSTNFFSKLYKSLEGFNDVYWIRVLVHFTIRKL